MLARDVVFEGFSASDWTRLLGAFEPTRRRTAPDAPRGGVIALHDGERLHKLLHTRAGRLDAAAQPWPAPLAELAERHRASWAAALRLGGLEELLERWGERARRGDDVVAQASSLFGIVRELEEDGAIELWPRRASAIPLPSPGLLRHPLDAVCPEGRAVVLGLFDEGELWTSIALLREGGAIARVVGPDDLRREMGLLSGDFRRDYRHLASAVERRVGPLAFGCFTQTAMLRALLTDASPGAWARAVGVRDVVLAPIPAAVALPLGVDAARATLGLLRTVAERLDPVGLLPPLLARLRSSAAEAAGDRPELLELLRRLISR